MNSTPYGLYQTYRYLDVPLVDGTKIYGLDIHSAPVRALGHQSGGRIVAAQEDRLNYPLLFDGEDKTKVMRPLANSRDSYDTLRACIWRLASGQMPIS